MDVVLFDLRTKPSGTGSPMECSGRSSQSLKRLLRFRGFVPRGLASRVVGASMKAKFLVALQLKIPHHFIKRCAGRRPRSLEPPAAFGTTKTPKILCFYPNQLATHGGPRLGWL